MLDDWLLLDDVVKHVGARRSVSMPSLQPRVVDAACVALLRDWVYSLNSCN